MTDKKEGEVKTNNTVYNCYTAAITYLYAQSSAISVMYQSGLSARMV